MSQESAQNREHVFGPVPSRRLGRSLGVDLVPYKVCTFDCIYCQLGQTTRKTTHREVFAPVEQILPEVIEKLKHVPRPDYVTLSGSGEPTLHAQLGDVISGIKQITDVPVAVLTNGSLFFGLEVRRECARADLVLPSLDAGDEETFRAINRAAPDLTLEGIVKGLAAFRQEYQGPVWLEVFLVDGVNTRVEQIARIRALTERIKPDRIQVNTAVRPTADAGVKVVPEEHLRELCSLLGPNAEVIADFRGVHDQPAFTAKTDEILAMVRRRPVTLDEISLGLGIHRNETSKYVEELLARNLITEERRGERSYLRAT